MVIEKTAPAEIQVNRKATFSLRMRNTGNATAHNVAVVDQVPEGTQFIDSTPPVTPAADGTVRWTFPALEPGAEVAINMNVLPRVAGEIGSVAQATFQSVASVRTVCTQPELQLDVKAPEQVLIGQPAALEITITNVGSGAAENIVIEEDVPEGFTHAAGQELEHVLGTLKPQESRRLTLVLNSDKPGVYANYLTARAEGELFVEDKRNIQVIAPQLQIAMQGPSLRYLDRQATYAVNLANPGTAAARAVELVTYLPKGMKYVTSDNHGQYDSNSHAVYWSLEELPASRQGNVHVTVLPIEPGSHKLKADAKAELGLQQACEHEVTVEGLAELTFAVSDVADPIEVGSDTTYEIKVQNLGSKPDANIQLVAELPPGLTPTTGDGPTQATVQGQTVVFAPLARMGANEEAIFKVHANGTAVGDHVIRRNCTAPSCVCRSPRKRARASIRTSNVPRPGTACVAATGDSQCEVMAADLALRPLHTLAPRTVRRAVTASRSRLDRSVSTHQLLLPADLAGSEFPGRRSTRPPQLPTCRRPENAHP